MDKSRALVGLALVGSLVAMKLVSCKRDPHKLVKGYECTLEGCGCWCSPSDNALSEGTCGVFECCYLEHQYGHAHVTSVCRCDHGDPATHACARPAALPALTERVEMCP